MLLNPDSVIPCTSYLPELVVSHRFDNRPSLSSSESMIKILRGPSQGKSNAAGRLPSWECCAYLNFIQPAENLLNLVNISHMTLRYLESGPYLLPGHHLVLFSQHVLLSCQTSNVLCPFSILGSFPISDFCYFCSLSLNYSPPRYLHNCLLIIQVLAQK